MGLDVYLACEVLHLFESSLCFVEFTLKNCVGTVSVVFCVGCGRTLEGFAVGGYSHRAFCHFKSMDVLMNLNLHLMKVLLLCLNFFHLHLVVVQNIFVECLEGTPLFVKHVSK